MTQQKRTGGLALFDLDQTLIAWDTQLLFCNWVLRKEPLRRLYLVVFVPFLVLSKVLGSEGMKRIFLSFLWRMPRQQLEDLVEEFVAYHVPRSFYPSMLEVLAEERAKGRRLVLVSASPEFYARPLGEALGFDASYGTRVEFEGFMPLFPDFTGGNNKKEVKVSRLLEEGEIVENEVQKNSSGFSDSTVDLPMLELCEEVTVVNPGEKLWEIAESRGWETVRPSRPFSSRRAMAFRCLRQICGLDTVSAG
tara:strand:- start:1389 stop:2138 length:750 start_codon:yes stop_codon:yes gene_type:complete